MCFNVLLPALFMSNTLEYIPVINLISVIYVIKGLYKIKTCRHTLKYIQVINIINVMYVIKGLIGMTACSNTLEYIQVINLINVIYVIKFLALSHNSHL
jgi:hypothetical protein